MTVWSLLGLGTNWKRVDKVNERAYLNYVATLVSGIVVLNGLYRDMKELISIYANDFCLDEDAMAEDFYKVIKGFGPKMPTTAKYSRFWELSIIGIPSAKELTKSTRYQENWDIAYKWAKEYEKSQTENIIAVKNKKIKELETELKEMDERIKRLESNFERTEIEK